MSFIAELLTTEKQANMKYFSKLLDLFLENILQNKT